MKLYLSSFRLGNNPEKLAALFKSNKKIAVIANAIDLNEPDERHMKVNREIQWLNELGLEASKIDLRDYFNNNQKLIQDLQRFAGVWVRGGNSFILRRAYMQSGFDKFILSKMNDNDFVYAGYSAGCCVLVKDMHGTDIVDDPNLIPQSMGYNPETIWEGLGLLDFKFVPHYKSDHPESALVDKEVQYYIKNNIRHKTFRDGEVLITNS